MVALGVRLPRRPERLLPQQYPAPVVVTPHVKVSPALTATQFSPPATARGVVLLAVIVPLPSSPSALSPQ